MMTLAAGDNVAKTCFLISSLSGGGAEGVCVTVASGIAEAGIDTDLVVLNLDRATYRERVSAKVNLVSLNVSQARYAFLPLIRHLNNSKPDVVLAFNYELALIMVLIRPFLRFKCQLIARNINTLSQSLNNDGASLKQRVIRALMVRLYSRVDHIVNQCEAMRSDLLNELPIAAVKTSVIYNPVNSYIETKANRELDSKQDGQPFILCAGRLTEQKAFDLAIHAFALFSEHFPDYRLKIVGQGALAADLKEVAQLKGVVDKVDFEGFQGDIYPYYAGAEFTLLTSLYEGFPNVLVESITAGTPIVAVNCASGPAEIVVDAANGYLVDSRSAQDIANVMMKAAGTDWPRANVLATATQYSGRNIIAKWRQLLNRRIN
jgi:glycosyltransferase involved in cell wall biosynthesis